MRKKEKYPVDTTLERSEFSNIPPSVFIFK
nr:MAG TPA_asm: hypothetical protein [Caudoviricetes sp.]